MIVIILGESSCEHSGELVVFKYLRPIDTKDKSDDETSGRK